MGSTDTPLTTMRSAREERFIAKVFGSNSDVDVDKRRCLYFTDPYHGDHIPIPVPYRIHRVSVYDDGSFTRAIEILTSSFYERNTEVHCSIIMGGARCLRAFTYALAERGMFLSPLPKLQRDVVVTGEYITPSWRALMRHVLAGRLIDRYSISEAFGGATSCETCGWWHFDPFVIPEVVTPVRRIPIEEGVGVLLITVLYPFQQAQPIVRYWTGDLVRTSISQTCHSGLFGFRPLGRLRNAVICSTCDTAVITPESLLCVFDQLPDIRRAPVLRDAHQVQPHWPLGEPIFRVAVSETQNDITAVVSFDAPSNTDVMRIDGQIRRLNPSLTEHSCAKEPTLIVTLA